MVVGINVVLIGDKRDTTALIRYFREKACVFMRKRVYISADYAEGNGDRNVVDLLNEWGNDNLHKVDFVDMAKVVSGSCSLDSDCRACDLKKEFNQQINLSSGVIFIVGDKTKVRKAGSACARENYYDAKSCLCTPYKRNNSGYVACKIDNIPRCYDDVNYVNRYSYLRHEFEQARLKNKRIIVIYNSSRKESDWLPDYMKKYEEKAHPFWIVKDVYADYNYIKESLGFE